MRVLIVDDEELARGRMQRKLDKIEHCDVVGEAENGDQALEKIQQLKPDLVFLDIRMPGKDGLEVAQALEHFETPPAIVFCTAYDDYALEAFNTLALGYLVKPIQTEQLEQAIEKCARLTRATKPEAQAEAGRQHITARTRKGVELIPIKSIQCFVADQKYVTVIYGDHETLIDESLKDLEGEFGALFYRIHRNALVAIDKIEALERESSGYTLRMRGSQFKPAVSRRHLSGIRALLETM